MYWRANSITLVVLHRGECIVLTCVGTGSFLSILSILPFFLRLELSDRVWWCDRNLVCVCDHDDLSLSSSHSNDRGESSNSDRDDLTVRG